MRKTLLFLLISVFAFNLFAQTDVTPSRYVFSTQPEGAYKVDAISPNKWNTPNSWAVLDESFDNGFIAIAGGPNISGDYTADNPLHKSIYEGITIVDMGGDVGKCLVMQGPNAKYGVGTPMGADYVGEGFNLSFFSGGGADKDLPKAKFRLKVVFSVAENVPNPSNSAVARMYYVTYTGNPKCWDCDGNKDFPGKFFALVDDLGRYVEDDDENFVYDPTVWQQFEYDIETDDYPVRFKLELGNLDKTTLLIKEIQFIKDPTGEPDNRKKITLHPTKSGLIDQAVLQAQLNYKVKNNSVEFCNLASNAVVDIYNVQGQKVSSLTSKDRTIYLNDGFYVAKAGNKIAKIIVK